MITAAGNPTPTTPLTVIGALCFGVVVGYITYRTLARTTDKAAITDLATVLGAIGGGVVTTLPNSADGAMFALYSIGLVVGMAVYVTIHLLVRGRSSTASVLGGDPPLRD